MSSIFMPLSSKEGLTMRIRYMLISSACRLALERIIPRFYGATRLSDSPTLENLDFPSHALRQVVSFWHLKLLLRA